MKLNSFLLGSKLGDGGFIKKSEGHNIEPESWGIRFNW